MSDFDKISIRDIVPSTYNPRKISNEEYNKLSNSISEFGVISPIIINLRNNHIIGGHQRYDVLYDEYISTGDYEELNIIRVGDIGWVFPSTDLKVKDLSTEKAMNLALNKISGEWNVPQLQNLLIDLDVDGYDLDLTGFDNMDLEEFNIDLKTNIKLETPQDKLQKALEEEDSNFTKNSVEKSPTTYESNDEEVTVYGEEEEEEEYVKFQEVETDIQQGDLFQLGDHMLMCGDCSNPNDVEKLMGDTLVDTVFTDPPYDLKDDVYMEPIKKYSKDANIFIMNSDENIVRYLRKSEFKFVQFFVANILFTLPRNNRAYLQHILVSHETNGDALHCRNLGKGLRSIINTKYRGFIKDEERVHKHQKSVDFVKFILEHYVVDNVLDCFGGSGSTLIACEELGVHCYMMEIEPQFVQIIINRWESITGKTAIKI